MLDADVSAKLKFLKKAFALRRVNLACVVYCKNILEVKMDCHLKKSIIYFTVPKTWKLQASKIKKVKRSKVSFTVCLHILMSLIYNLIPMHLFVTLHLFGCCLTIKRAKAPCTSFSIKVKKIRINKDCCALQNICIFASVVN